MYVHTWPALWEWMEARDLSLKLLLPSHTFGFSIILEASWPCYSQHSQPVQRFLVSEATMDWANLGPNCFSCWDIGRDSEVQLFSKGIPMSHFSTEPRVSQLYNVDLISAPREYLQVIANMPGTRAWWVLGEHVAPQGTWCQIIHIWPVPGWVSAAEEPPCCGLLKCRSHLSSSLSRETTEGGKSAAS